MNNKADHFTRRDVHLSISNKIQRYADKISEGYLWIQDDKYERLINLDNLKYEDPPSNIVTIFPFKKELSWKLI